MLNTASPLPLYHQLAELLSAQIRAGEVPEGGRIESEHALCARYGVGRPTVRQATDVLVRRRMIERRRGAGTFVLPRSPRVDLFSLSGTSSAFRDSGLSVTSKLLQAPRRVEVPMSDAGDADSAPRGDMANPFAGGAALSMQRLSKLDGQPVLLEKLWLHAELFDGLRALDLRGRSLSQVVEEKYFLKPLRADQRFAVVTVGGRDGRELGLRRPSPILLVKRRIDFRTADGAIYAELYCRTDRLAFSQIIEGAPDA